MDLVWSIKFGRMWAEIGSIGVSVCPGCAAALDQNAVALVRDADGRIWQKICYDTRRCATHNRPKACAGSCAPSAWSWPWVSATVMICPECGPPYEFWWMAWATAWRDIGVEAQRRDRSDKLYAGIDRSYAPPSFAGLRYVERHGKIESWEIERKKIESSVLRSNWNRFLRKTLPAVVNRIYADRKWWRKWRHVWGKIGREHVRMSQRFLNPAAKLEDLDAASRRFALIEIS